MRCRSALLPLSVVLIAIGCQDPDVRVYKAPKPHEYQGTESGGYTILGAIFPAEDPVWFFKLTGEASAIAANEKVFDQLIESVKLPDAPGGKLTWTLPPGAKEGPPREMRLATILIGDPASPLEISISEAKGGKQANLARWANQVGLPPAQAEKGSKPIKTASGAAGLRVAMSGPKNPSASGPMMMGGR